MAQEKVIVSWSGGKDSTLALYEVQKAQRFKPVSLMTVATEDYDRISMHGVRRALLEQQAESLGFSLEKVFISKDISNKEYDFKIQKILARYPEANVFSVVFGDIFLEDLRKYREERLSKVGMKAVFPIWKRNTSELAHAFIDLGFKAILTCIDSKYLDKSFAGREFNRRFLSELPSDVDPCGENGEFHSFVYDGPIFKERISCNTGEVVLRNSRFFYCDLIPA